MITNRKPIRPNLWSIGLSRVYFYEWEAHREAYRPLFMYSGMHNVHVENASPKELKTRISIANMDVLDFSLVALYSSVELGIVWTQYAIESGSGAIISNVYIAPGCFFDFSVDNNGLSFWSVIRDFRNRFNSDIVRDMFTSDMHQEVAYFYQLQSTGGNGNMIDPESILRVEDGKEEEGKQLFIGLDAGNGEVDDFIP